MGLSDDLQEIAAAAGRHAAPDERLSAVIPAEPSAGERVFLCAFEGAGEASRTWLALDESGSVISERRLVRAAVSIAVLCETAEEASAHPEDVMDSPPRLATPSYLDELGAAMETSGASFAAVIGAAAASANELELEVERGYKVPLR